MTTNDIPGNLASTLTTQCLELAKHLADKGMALRLSLKIKTIDFELIVDTTKPRPSGDVPTKNKKKKSASTLARDAKRREEHRKKTRNTASVPASSRTQPHPQQTWNSCGSRPMTLSSAWSPAVWWRTGRDTWRSARNLQMPAWIVGKG